MTAPRRRKPDAQPHPPLALDWQPQRHPLAYVTAMFAAEAAGWSLLITRTPGGWGASMQPADASSQPLAIMPDGSTLPLHRARNALQPTRQAAEDAVQAALSRVMS